MSSVSYKGNSPSVYFFDKISDVQFGFEKFSCSSEVIKKNLSTLFDDVHFASYS